MKKFTKVLILLACTLFSFPSFAEELNINVATPGTLSTLLTDAQKQTVTKLTLTGTLNDDDISFVHNLAFDHLKTNDGLTTNGTLKDLDLSDANFVAMENGEKYLVTKDSLLGDFSNSILKNISLPKTLVYIGSRAFSDCDSLVSINIPNSVTTIGEEAFTGCNSLTSINIPKGLTTINYETFAGCKSLASINIPNSVTTIGKEAFYECDSLVISFTASVKKTGDGAFSGCKGLNLIIDSDTAKFSQDVLNHAYAQQCKAVIQDGVICVADSALYFSYISSVTIPESVVKIGNSAFGQCRKLRSVNLNKVETIGSYAFAGCGLQSADLNNVTTIGKGAFVACYLTSVALNAVKSVGDSAFYESSLSSLELGSVLENIGEGAFEKTQIKTVTFPNTLLTIGKNAFHECYLTNVTIPASVTSIGTMAFAENKHLRNINVDADNKNYSSADGVLFDKNKNELLQFPCYSSLDVYEIPTTVNTIDEYAFCKCNGLTSITIPDGVKQINDCLFEECSSLATVNIPNGSTYIGKYAFYGCDSLKTITIPNTVTYIGKYAFNGCEHLVSANLPTEIKYLGVGAFAYTPITSINIPLSLDSLKSSFYECKKLKTIWNYNPKPIKLSDFSDTDKSTCILYVPKGSLNAYTEAEGWSDFRKIVEFDASGINDVKMNKTVVSRYDLNGRKLSTPSHGINLLKYSDGTTQKVILK